MPADSDSRGFRLAYNSGLDGLRGMAVLFVVGAHGRVLPGGLATLGVNLFFVLSGFLITCIMMQEWNQFGSISLRNFYVRRALRLIPGLVLVLFSVLAYQALTKSMFHFKMGVWEAVRALFYMTNWSVVHGIGHTDLLGHTWSLSVEEQFYLSWPLVMVLLLRHAPRWVLMGLVFLGVLLSMAIRFQFANSNAWDARIYLGTDTRADSLLMGCLLGMGFSWNLIPNSARFKSVIGLAAVLSAIGCVWLACRFGQDPLRQQFYWGWPLVSLWRACP
jgi:peptidoglycan/LPS O-acetylase OafA/YrhL